MSLLAYWKYSNFLSDMSSELNLGGLESEQYGFNSNQASLHDSLNIGDRLWLASYRKIEGEPVGLILGKLVITRKEFNAPGHKYGVYRVVGDSDESELYDPENQDSTNVLMELEFEPPRPISSPQRIGQSLQAMRRLTYSDEMTLERSAGLLAPFSDE